MTSTDAAPAPAPRSRFVHPSPVHFDELDAMAMLHNARYAVHVERATSALFAHLGCSEAGVHARGRRTVVKLEPASLRPARWTERFREAHAGLQRAGSA
jgi:acyl-CoA thioesterase FadM